MLTTDEAAQVARVNSRLVYRWIEADKLHFTETTGSRLLVCIPSLNRMLDDRRND